MSAQPRTRPDPTRDRILTAAIELFAVQGYAATTEDKLLAAAELGPTAFRVHFADTEQCFLAAYDLATATARHRLLASVPRHLSWPERLAAGLRTLLELIDANAAASRLVLVQSQCAGEAALERYTATLESFAPFMREGRECSTAPEHLPPIVDTMLPGGVAFSLRRQLLRGEAVGTLYPDLLRFLLLPYRGEAETAACLADSPPPGASTQPGSPRDSDQR